MLDAPTLGSARSCRRRRGRLDGDPARTRSRRCLGGGGTRQHPPQRGRHTPRVRPVEAIRVGRRAGANPFHRHPNQQIADVEPGRTRQERRSAGRDRERAHLQPAPSGTSACGVAGTQRDVPGRPDRRVSFRFSLNPNRRIHSRPSTPRVSTSANPAGVSPLSAR